MESTTITDACFLDGLHESLSGQTFPTDRLQDADPSLASMSCPPDGNGDGGPLSVDVDWGGSRSSLSDDPGSTGGDDGRGGGGEGLGGGAEGPGRSLPRSTTCDPVAVAEGAWSQRGFAIELTAAALRPVSEGGLSSPQPLQVRCWADHDGGPSVAVSLRVLTREADERRSRFGCRDGEHEKNRGFLEQQAALVSERMADEDSAAR